jgi:hypothetical protein
MIVEEAPYFKVKPEFTQENLKFGYYSTDYKFGILISII